MKQENLDIIDRIFQLLNTTKKGDYPLEKEIGVARGSLMNWRNHLSKPGTDALIKIANYFNVTTDYLLGRDKSTATAQNTPNNVTISPLVARIESLDKLQQAKVMAYIDGLQGVNDPIEAAFRHGQELEKAKQSYAPTGSQKKKFN